MSSFDYDRLLELKNLIDLGQASSEEKREYVTMLYENGSISKEQYDSFQSSQNTENIVKAALIIGGVMITSWLLSKIFDKN